LEEEEKEEEEKEGGGLQRRRRARPPRWAPSFTFIDQLAAKPEPTVETLKDPSLSVSVRAPAQRSA